MSAQALHSLHLTYCNISGYSPKYQVYESAWHDYVRKGFTEADLRCVLLFLQRENRRNTFCYSLRLGKLLDFQYHHFADMLSEAQAKERNRRKPKTGREQVLSLYERKVNPELGPAALPRSLKEILRSIIR